MLKFVRHHISTIFILLIVVGAALRLISLGAVPRGLQNDEASFVLNTVSLMQTGKDEDGRPFPLFLNSFIDPKPALYSYLQMPFIAIFGLTTATSRLPAVLFGLLSLILVYRITFQLTQDKTFATLALALVTISPWHILMSRSTQEVIVSFTCGLVAIHVLIQAIQQHKKTKLFTLGTFFVFSSLTMYFYHSAKIFLPLLTFAVIIAIRQTKIFSALQKSSLYIVAVVAAFLLTSILGGFTRFQAVGIFTDQQPQLIVDEQIRTATPYLPQVVIRAFHNKVVGYGYALAGRYLQHFSAPFLFLDGGEPARYHIPQQGLLYVIELPLLLIGVCVALAKKEHRSTTHLMLAWLLLAPLPATLTWQQVPSTIRAFPMVVPLAYFVAVGIFSLWNIAKQQKLHLFILKHVLVFAYILSLVFFLNQFAVQFTYLKPWHRNTADEKLADVLKKHVYQYERIVITRAVSGQPYVYLVLNGLIPLKNLQTTYPERTKPAFTLGTFEFVEQDCPFEQDTTTLFVLKHGCTLPRGYSIIQSVGYDDGLLQYDLVKYEPTLAVLR